MDLDHACEDALKQLYENPDGLPFDNLGINGEQVLYLSDGGFALVLDDMIVNVPGNRFVVQGATLKITTRGRAYVEALREKLSKQNEARAEKHKERIHDFVIVILTAALTLLVEYLVRKFLSG